MNPDFSQPLPKNPHGAAKVAIKAIIRPPRQEYNLSGLINNVYYDLNKPPIPRINVSFKNRNNLTIIGSFYKSINYSTETKHDCLVYLHGNVSSQKEGMFTVRHVAPLGISVFCFDFSGSGLSEGKYVTMGYNEHHDIIDATEFLAKNYQIRRFVLMGRSMGASAALMAAPHIKNIAGFIINSAFTSLQDLFNSISSQANFPSLALPVAMLWMKKKLKNKAKFNPVKVKPIESAKKCNFPLLIGHARDDSFIPLHMAESILNEYACSKKELFLMEGGHNGARPEMWQERCLEFIVDVLSCSTAHFGPDSALNNTIKGDDRSKKLARTNSARDLLS
ncbi:Clan SC, family S9, unassigned serine peptidase [Tritrichomonas foetus]|uniref:Clan SC, family S9, unassigned serine peptidase n=1 Tax=Tritrichomonas foetus TaxID=1144522 RepID=A0A1J4JTX0_9EUKA|nr:Clan SC, family S9, unassigned serine peptidase [Tritrichomonas foetus]|eukprot:OHT02575.1 Clan SC, family S9, unassigned serine peptidase [Tritrichomonas foetus]